MPTLNGKLVVTEARIAILFYPRAYSYWINRKTAWYILEAYLHTRPMDDSFHSQKFGCKIYAGWMLSVWTSLKLDPYIFYTPNNLIMCMKTHQSGIQSGCIKPRYWASQASTRQWLWTIYRRLITAVRDTQRFMRNQHSRWDLEHFNIRGLWKSPKKPFD